MAGVSSTSSSSEGLLVRCPRCGNILPEFLDLPLYQCGGCGAVLRDIAAKRKGLVEDGLSSKSGDGAGRVVFGKATIAVKLDNAYETDERRNGGLEANMTLELHNPSSLRNRNGVDSADSIGVGKRERVSARTRFRQPISDRSIYRDEYELSKNRLERGGKRNVPLDSYGYIPMEASPQYDPYRKNYDGYGRDVGLEYDKAKLLRKIGELNDQLGRMCEIAESPNQEGTVSYGVRDVYRQGLFGVNKKPLGQGRHALGGHPHITQPCQHPPQMCYHSGCHDPYMDLNTYPLRQNPQNHYHQNREAHQVVPPPEYGIQRSHVLKCADDWLYNQQRRPRSSQAEKTDLGRPKKVIIAISGGAPFITCGQCKEILRLPVKLRTTGKNRNKMRCESCSSIIVYELGGKGIISSSPRKMGKDYSLPVEFPNTNDSDDAASRYDNVTKWSHEQKEKQSSVKDEPEMDISMNESENSRVSVESFEVSKDYDQLNDQNGSESFQEDIKGSIVELSSSGMSSQILEDRRSNVFVNGQLIPAPEVKRAEKLAGPIQLGKYWYDVRAGFWGVIGHPCLGIIPPNIEEFNYPMPKHCAAGNTGVFVNGRELHETDLNILVSRGLPITENKSYLIEISGKVVDEQTGQELDSLGKLAPTVERVRCGFGMKVPKWIEEQSD
ncbi:unnamed protein product [Cuscuta epithymum]|uniref:Zinc-ribbon domain-containing protein n=1 Tax=Cuscuta epithymum TaxID=186058 RepID=A0AAV0D942_9ASTE|nr:unnamed protein product [Cuscuta epithymum]